MGEQETPERRERVKELRKRFRPPRYIVTRSGKVYRQIPIFEEGAREDSGD